MSATTPKYGRPRDPDRMRRVLEAAARQFVGVGYERATIDTIAKISGVSNVTIYSYFPSKSALFETVVGTYTDVVFAPLPPEALPASDPAKALKAIGTRFLMLIRSDDVIGTFRTMFAAAGHVGAASLAFYRQGPEKLILQTRDYLRRANTAGSLSIDAPEVAADQFLSLFLGGAYLRSMLGLGKPSSSQDKKLVSANVRLFLQAHRST